MSIYEYDEERQRRFDKEEGYELGHEAGRELERKESQQKLKELIRKNLERGLSVEAIAEFLGEPKETVQNVAGEVLKES